MWWYMRTTSTSTSGTTCKSNTLLNYIDAIAIHAQCVRYTLRCATNVLPYS